MNETFDFAFDKLIILEGGYDNNPFDEGGETKYGITKKQYPLLNIADITLDEAKEIYYNDYWLTGSCDKMPIGVDIFHFDGCVNHGVGSANKLIQRSIKAVPDGIIGPKSLDKIIYYSKDINYFIMKLAIERLHKYHRITIHNQTQDVFLKGWFKRILLLCLMLLTKFGNFTVNDSNKNESVIKLLNETLIELDMRFDTIISMINES